MSNRAWVTLATNDSYGLGALVLAYSLRRVGSASPAVVLITPAVTEAMRERLRAVYAEVITVDVLDSRDAAHLALLQRPELGITFTKIHCWNLTQYEKCVFLDADTLVVQNCDELFEREELSAAPDVGWPDCFNSGVFVFRPSQETFEKLIKFAKERGSFDGGDQGLLNSFFSDWPRGDINKHLPFVYNVTSAAFYSYLPALKQYGQNLKIIHFIGATKPWLQKFNWDTRTVDAQDHLRELLQLWWDLFVGQVHPQLDVSMVEVEEEAQAPEAPPAILPQDVDYHYAPKLDPDSEFPWHHPEAQIPHEELSIAKIDMTQIHDPWDYYKGNIPSLEDDWLIHNVNSENTDDYRQRNYGWDYKAPTQEYNQSSHVETEQTIWHQQPKQQDHSRHDSFHQWYTNQSYEIFQNKQQEEHNIPQHWEYQTQQSYSQHSYSQEHSQQHYQSNEHQYQDNKAHQDTYQHEQHRDHHIRHTYHEEQKHDHHIHRYTQHYEQLNDNITQSHQFPLLSQGHEEQQDKSVHSYHECFPPQHHNEHLHDQASPFTHEHNSSQYHYDHQHDHSSHSHPDQCSQGHSYHSSHHESNPNNVQTQPFHPEKQNYDHERYLSKSAVFTVQKQTTDNNVYHVNLDYVRRRSRRKQKLNRSEVAAKEALNVTEQNGNVSDTESDDYEDIIPRHPYDGFYLRHRATIDSRGHKICTHEVPPTPSPPDSPPPLESDTSSSIEEYCSASECEDQSGVAGNLARVVPGAAGFQREALDELTRRQGWEAGNIDYMGADSFANIWAKISQTLTQPRSSPPKESPPKEPTPPPKQTPPKESPPKEPTPLPKQTPPKESAPKESTPPPKQTPPKESPPKETTPPPKEQLQPETKITVAPVNETVQEPVSEPIEVAIEVLPTATVPAPEKPAAEVEDPVTVKEITLTETLIPSETPVPVELSTPIETAKEAIAPVEARTVPASVETESSPQETLETAKEEAKEKTDSSVVPTTPPAIPKSIPEVSTPVIETPLQVKDVTPVETPIAAAATPESSFVTQPPSTPAVSESTLETTSESTLDASAISTDSPPLAHTPSKEDPPPIPAAKSEQRRKPAGKLELAPPAAADPLPTPDSELEDAASLAHAIIASELGVPAPAPASASPALPPPPPAAGAVSLAQIGVKPAKDKTTTAAQIESSVSDKAPPAEQTSEPSTPATPTEKKALSTPKRTSDPKKTESPTPATPTEKKTSSAPEQTSEPKKTEPSTPTSPTEKKAPSTPVEKKSEPKPTLKKKSEPSPPVTPADKSEPPTLKKKSEPSPPVTPADKSEPPTLKKKSEPSPPVTSADKSEPLTTTPSAAKTNEPATSASSEDQKTPVEPPKKTRVGKVIKKQVATSGEAPVPPPRSKEKKPKDK